MQIKKGTRVLVTGGAGFIGSHIVDRLTKLGCKVKVYDNLSTGSIGNLLDSGAEVVVGDLLDYETLKKEMEGIEIVFHFAAHADLKNGVNDTKSDLDQNTVATFSVLDAMNMNGVKKIVFASSSAIYGEPRVFPTPEDYSPTQNSLYGASKEASEGLIEAYVSMFGFQAWIYRFVSVVGERYSHGIVYDLTEKMKKNQKELLIMGDGTQRKSFLYVGDLVNAVFLSIKKSNEPINVFNLGNTHFIRVKNAARAIAEEYGYPNIKFKYVGGKSGWKGDSPFVFLDITKIQKLGWKPTIPVEDGLRLTTRYLKGRLTPKASFLNPDVIRDFNKSVYGP